jgi:chromosomal replication initiator protein
MESVWPRCLERLEAEFSAEDVHTWLKPLQAAEQGDGLVLYAPNAFVVDTVRERYLARIRELAAHFGGSPAAVSLEVGSLARETAAPPSYAATPARAADGGDFQGNRDKRFPFED